ncbi:MAG: Gfo/Idh/MocA family protein [Pirellulales bacterium]
MKRRQQPRYKAAIIGLGFIGAGDQVSGDRLGQQVRDLDGTHAASLGNHSSIELVAGSSRDVGRRERFAARTGCRTYADWRKMLKIEQPDIVSVATYAPQHAKMVVACAAAGVKAIFCEKPLATRLADGEVMLAACQATGTLLAVNHNRRFHLLYSKLQAFIAEGRLGELTSGRVEWGTGRLGNVGTHFFDAIRFVTGRPIAAVSGTLDPTGRPDCRGKAFRDPGGWGWLALEETAEFPPLMVAVDAGDNSTSSAQLVLHGTHGSVVMADTTATWYQVNGRKQTWQVGTGPSSMDQAVGAIVAHLDQRQPFPHSAKDALHVLEAIIAFHASHRRHSEWVRLPLQGRDRKIVVRSG